MTMTIPLTQGMQALVDDDDYAAVSTFRWYAMLRAGLWCAVRSGPRPKKTPIYMHREIVCPPHGLFVDHINGNSLDNRRSNLRVCTNAENGRNRKTASNNTSGHRGISWSKRKGKWECYIKIDGKQLHVGFFDDLADAACARVEAEVKHYGEFSPHLSRLEVTNE